VTSDSAALWYSSVCRESGSIPLISVHCIRYLLFTLLVYGRWWIWRPSARRKPSRIKIYLSCTKGLLPKVGVALRSSSVRDHFCTHCPLSCSTSKCCTGSDLVKKEVSIPYFLLCHQKHCVNNSSNCFLCEVLLCRAKKGAGSLAVANMFVATVSDSYELTNSAIRRAGTAC